jgi:hypothetical protein
MRRLAGIVIVLVALVGVPVIVGVVASSQPGSAPEPLAAAPFAEGTLIYVQPRARNCVWRSGHANLRCKLTNGWTCTIEIEHQTAVCLTQTTVSSEPLLGYGAPPSSYT